MLTQSISCGHKWDLSFWYGHIERHWKMQLWGTACHMLHPEKQNAQRITSTWRVPLKERKRERALGVNVRPWWMTMKEKRKRKWKVTQHQHATQKGLEVWVNFEPVFFGYVNKQYTLVFGDANESAIFFVMLIDVRYVVMQMNWPFWWQVSHNNSLKWC